jgi:DNA repair protein RadA/Sms
VVGGVRIADPAADLAVSVAVAGAATDRLLAPQTVVLGEVGLGGEVRRASRIDVRLAEASALGQRLALMPAGGRVPTAPGLRLQPVATVSAALGLLGEV